MAGSQGSDKRRAVRGGRRRAPAVADHHARLHAQFRWDVPARFNIAQACCTRWAQAPDGASRVAIRAHGGGIRFGVHRGYGGPVQGVVSNRSCHPRAAWLRIVPSVQGVDK